MIKLREARWCNLKLLLIFCVIYGHLIEPEIDQSPALMAQYKWIYLFHMPMFAFLSGLFLRDCRSCLGQIRRLFPLYAVLQVAAVVLGRGQVRASTPCWILWYLLSAATWSGVGWLWFRFLHGRGRLLILTLSVLTGLAAGAIPCIGRAYSLSRTLVFFPYFWTGLICSRDFPWKKLRPAGIFALALAILLTLAVGHRIPTTFLYQAEPYQALHDGLCLRLLCYLLGGLLCLFLLAFAPSRRFPFTKAGADTMPAYLIHAPIALAVRRLAFPWGYYPLIAVGILYLVHKISQWYGHLYGVVPRERRDDT